MNTLMAQLDMFPVDPLLEDELHLEEQGRERGIQRFWDKAQSADEKMMGTRNAPVASLYAGLVDPLEARLKVWMKNVDERIAAGAKVTDEVRAAAVVGELGAGRVAIVAARVICDRIASLPTTQASLMRPIGEGVRDEWTVKMALRDEPNILDDLTRKLKGANSRITRSYSAASARKALERNEKDGVIPLRVRDNIGTACIKSLLEVWPVIEQTWVDRGIGRHKALAIGLAPQAAAWMQQVMEDREELHPPRPHMVVPPARHTDEATGGYIGSLKGKLQILKHRNPEKATVLSDLTVSVVNDLQETPFRLNPTVMDAWKDLAARGNGEAKFPITRDPELDLPPYPQNVEKDSQEAKDWRRRMHEVRNEKGIRLSAAFEIAEARAEVERMEGYDRIYAPMVSDFRTRLYCATSAMSYQGAKWQRSVYRFARSKPLGKRGAHHLAVQIANSMDDCSDTGLKLSKVDFETRVGWTQDRSALIEKTARDWRSTFDWWSKADDPFALLAACHEWAGYVREGDDYECGLVVAYDGTCNGLQHYAAMLRDPATAKAVNLEFGKLPEDVYRNAADALKAVIVARALDGDPMAMFWLAAGCITRDLVKTNIMTLPYGVTEFGASKQLTAKLKDKKIKCDAEQRQWLHKALWKIIQDLVPAATEGMGWLRDCANSISVANKPIWWTTPTGSRVMQTSPTNKPVKVKTRFHGKQFEIMTRDQLLDMEDGFKAMNGLPPNIVHSFDASHLQLTARRMMDEGVRDLLFIHDSYGCMPADGDHLNRVLREEFVDMYRKPVWQRLVGELQSQLPDGHGLRSAPALGTFDIESVLKSPFFFA